MQMETERQQLCSRTDSWPHCSSARISAALEVGRPAPVGTSQGSEGSQPMSAGKLRSSGCPGPRGPISTSLDPVIDPKVELRGTEPPLYLKILSLLLKLCSVFYFQNYFFCQINLYIILFIFGCARSLLLLGLFSSCCKQGLL